VSNKRVFSILAFRNKLFKYKTLQKFAKFFYGGAPSALRIVFRSACRAVVPGSKPSAEVLSAQSKKPLLKIWNFLLKNNKYKYKKFLWIY
jgi:hypothetical protein